MYDRNEEDNVMSFSDLSNFDLIMEKDPVRTVILDRIDNNAFIHFIVTSGATQAWKPTGMNRATNTET